MSETTTRNTVRHTATLLLEQPAALGRGPRSDDTPAATFRHVPGSVLRGALARAWMLEHGAPQTAPAALRAEFLHLFEGGVRYGPLFDPASDVVPLSVGTCKYRPQPDCSTSFADGSVSDTEDSTCRACRGPLQAGRGEVEFFGTDDGVVETTHVALDEEERAAEGQLFSRRALAPRIHGAREHDARRALTGELFVKDPERAAWLFTPRPVRIGGRRSVSGAARYEPSPPCRIDARVPRAGEPLLLRLLSPAILVDPAGRPVNRPDEHRLAQLLGVRAVSVRRRAWVRTERVGGWNALTNFPKPVDLAVSAGSVYLLNIEGTVDAAGMERLIAHGLGIRRSEGYGFLACGPWRLPRLAEPAPLGSEQQGRADRMARRLAETGEGAWFLDKLRPVLRERRLGEPVDLGFLSMRRADVLNSQARLRELVEAFATRGDPDVLDASLVRLEAHVRGMRSL